MPSRFVNSDGISTCVRKLRLCQPFAGFRPPYPLYTASPDKGFVAACDALLANKLMTAQWWEEDQLDESGFFTIKGKALSYVHRPDGSVLGIGEGAGEAAVEAVRRWAAAVLPGELALLGDVLAAAAVAAAQVVLSGEESEEVIAGECVILLYLLYFL